MEEKMLSLDELLDMLSPMGNGFHPHLNDLLGGFHSHLSLTAALVSKTVNFFLRQIPAVLTLFFGILYKFP